MIANWVFEALEISNPFFVKEGKIALFAFAIILKTCFFIINNFYIKFSKKKQLLTKRAVIIASAYKIRKKNNISNVFNDFCNNKYPRFVLNLLK